MNRLKEIRKQNKLTQDQVANIIGVAKTTYCNYENSVREIEVNINGNTLQYIANGKRRKELTSDFIVPLRKNLLENKKIYFEKYGGD